MSTAIATSVLAATDLSYLKALLTEVTTADNLALVLRSIEVDLLQEANLPLVRRCASLRRRLESSPRLTRFLIDGDMYLKRTLYMLQEVRRACESSQRKRSSIPPPDSRCFDDGGHKILEDFLKADDLDDVFKIATS